MVTTVEKWTCRWSWEMNGDPRQLATVTQRWINHYAATWLCTNNHVTTSCPARIFHFASGLVPSFKPASSQLIAPLDFKKCFLCFISQRLKPTLLCGNPHTGLSVIVCIKTRLNLIFDRTVFWIGSRFLVLVYDCVSSYWQTQLVMDPILLCTNFTGDYFKAWSHYKTLTLNISYVPYLHILWVWAWPSKLSDPLTTWRKICF